MKEQQKLSGSPKHPDTAATILKGFKSQPLVSEGMLEPGTNAAMLLDGTDTAYSTDAAVCQI